MTRSIADVVTRSCHLLALGEPTHLEPAFSWVRNDLFADAAGLGFRSIALETDRVTALAIDAYAQGGDGDLDEVMGLYSHDWGVLEPNRHLIAWMRAYNAGRPAHERLTFHGFDAPTEPTGAPSPRAHLEHARDHLKKDIDIASIAGDDERWSSMEATWDHTKSPGATEDAKRLRLIADDLVTDLHDAVPAPEGRRAWLDARTHLQAGIALLRYHRHAAEPGDPMTRMARLLGARDVIMAENLLDIRAIEAARGATLVFAANAHLQRHRAHWSPASWTGAGAIVSTLMGDGYRYIAGALGRSTIKDLADPAPGTFEAGLTGGKWSIITGARPNGEPRTDHTPQQGYFPLDSDTFEDADAILYIPDADTVG